MQIILGHHLDTGSYPDVCEGKEAREGRIIVGPTRLISVLETRLGLLGDSAHQAVRIGQYLKKLKAADNSHRFYSQSIQADAWSTAKKLLSWRDDLLMSGWGGNVPKGAKGRLKDLADIEKLSDLRLDSGLGERLQGILSALSRSPKPDIQTISFVEPLESWQPFWQSLFRGLAGCGIELARISKKPLAAGTDLGLLRKAMQRSSPGKQTVRGDGTLCVLRAKGEWEAAEALASWLYACQKDLEDFLIIRSTGSTVLDDSLKAYDLPELGADSRSRWRTSLQVLPLVLANTWEPFDPHRLLELLVLPKSPLSKKIARRFERALREHPGTGGPKWKTAWEKSTADFLQSQQIEPDAQEYGSSIADFESRTRFWLGEVRYHPDKGIPAGKIKEICSKVSQWAAKRGGVDQDDLLVASASIAMAVSDAVEAAGIETVSRPQLDRILDSVVGDGLENPEVFPRAAPWSQAHHPGQIWGPAKTLVWWDFNNPGNGRELPPWTSEEEKLLRSVGVELEPSAKARARQAEAWRRPVRWASDRLILVVTSGASEERGVIHPLWDEIRYLLNMKEADFASLTIDAARLRQTKDQDFMGTVIKRAEVPRAPMPCSCRHWRIPCPDICIQPYESFTSMQKLIQCPLSWVFEYILGLSSGDLVSLPDGSHMVGPLGHAIVERLFSLSDQWEPNRAREKAEEIFDELVPQMAITLLHPGRELERIRYRENIGKGVHQLAAFLNSVKLRTKDLELKTVKPFSADQKFTGKIDLVLAAENGQPLFMDLKWTEWPKYKRLEMEQTKPLQLAAYSWLLSDEQHDYPPGGFYLLLQGEPLFSSCAFLPDHACFSEVNLREVWEKALETYRWRISELKNGLAVAEGVSTREPADWNADDQDKKDISIALPPDAFRLEAPCGRCGYSNLCGRKE